MKRFVIFAFLANSWVQAQQIYLPDPLPGARTNTLARARDGVFLLDLAAGVRATMEDRSVVVRFPIVRTTAPRVKGIILADSQANLRLTSTPKGFVLLGSESAAKPGCIMLVILDKALVEEPVRVVVLEQQVFWDVRVNRAKASLDSGWLSLPIEVGQEAARCLRDAARVFDASEKRVLDLRLTEAERAQPAKVQGQLTDWEITEIRQTVYAMAGQQIIERLAGQPAETWAELLQAWPGRHGLDITTTDGRQAGVYYAPNAGYQLEKIDGKWTIVGG